MKQKQQPKIPPILMGDIIQVTPHTKGSKEDLVAKYKGFIIIIKGAGQIGTLYTVKISKVYPTYAFAEIMFI